jgi:hypothetical protein
MLLDFFRLSTRELAEYLQVMMVRCFERREAVSKAVSVAPAPRRIQEVHADPTDCIVCTVHIVGCMALVVILAELLW